MKENKYLPKVSVVITSYNYENYIGEAIESVIAQTYQNWELIVVDDGSTDNSVEVIAQYAEAYPDKIRLIAQTENRGVGYVANLGIENATTDYIANLGSDDRMMPERLEKQMAYFIRHPEVGAVCSDVLVINGDGQTIAEETIFSKPVTDLRMQLLEGNFINSPSATFKKSIHSEIGEFNPVLDYVQDFDHWLRVLEKYDIKRLDDKLTAYRIHGNNLSVQPTPGQLPYAGSYETFIAIIRAIKRRDMALQNTKLSKEEVIDGKLFLANAAKNAEERFLGSFKYSVSLVYCLLLDVFELEAHHQEATELLNIVYTVLGDKPRAMGEKPITLDDLSLSDKSEFTTPQETVLTTHRKTGLPLSIIVKSIFTNKKELFHSELDKETFLIDVAKGAFRQLKQQMSDNHEKGFSHLQRDALQNILTLLHSEIISQKHHESLTLLDEVNAWKTKQEYQEWINNHALLEIDAQLHAERLATWQHQPLFHLVMVMFTGEQALLADTIDSLSKQFYDNWKLSVIADGPAPDPMFDEVAVLEWVSFPEDANVYEFINQYIINERSDWILYIPAGVQFESQIFLQMGDYINRYPDLRIIYTDDDVIDQQGSRDKPRFKPDFSIDLLRSSDYLGILACHHSLFESVGGFDALPGRENLSLAFKTYERMGSVAIGHIQEVLIHVPVTQADHNPDVLKQAVINHLSRIGTKGFVTEGLIKDTTRVQYMHDEMPKVSIIIPTKDKLEFLRPCVESVLDKTGYQNIEILIIDNQSQSPDTLAFLDEVKQGYSNLIKVLDYPYKFNYAAISNMAASNASGEYLLFLNNDTEVLHSEWLERMMQHAQRSDVGIVGARLVFPETGLIQHAGVILGQGVESTADHPYIGVLNLQESGQMGRAQLDQNFSAVTGACLLIKKTIYDSVQGMDEEKFPVSYNDIDLCLKVGQAGYLVVWSPYTTLVHHGSITQHSEIKNRNRAFSKEEGFKVERKNFLKKWLPQISADPAVNKHLSLAYRDMRIESEMPLNWDGNFHDRTRIFGLPLSGGSGDYRIIQPFEALRHAAVAQCEYYRFSSNLVRPILVSEYARLAPDTVVFQAAINDIQLDQIEQVAEFLPDIFRVYTVDDLLTNVPEKNPVHIETKRHFSDAKSRIRRALSACNRLIVSTQPLADLCEDMIDDIYVIPNRLSRFAWCSLESHREQGDKPRVGWAGAQQHEGDLAVIIDVVKETANEVDWIFMGMCPKEIRPYIKEFHEFVSIKNYPEKLASLNLDLAVAPLDIHPFNESKSNLRLLEYGVLGWPVICTDIYPYQTNNPPVTLVSNNKQEWLTAIRTALSDKQGLQSSGDMLKQWVLEHYVLEDYLDEWLQALTR